MMTTCGACGGPIIEPEATPIAKRQPCPTCGSTARLFGRIFEGGVTPRGSLATKLVRGATGRVAQEQFVGADQTVSDGTWTEKAVVVDYENDRYVERVVREQDGVELRNVDEPLSSHHGRGSDRPDRRAAREAIKAARQEERATRKAARDLARRAGGAPRNPAS
jgi:hypothetical protein